MHCFGLKNILKFWTIISAVGKCDNNFNNYNNIHSSNKSFDKNLLIQSHSLLSTSESMTNTNVNRLKPDLSVYTLTWNIKSETPKCDLTQLLNILSNVDNNGTVCPLADIYVIGLQEVPNRISNILFTDPWIEAFDTIFKQLDYIRVKYIRLMGVLLLLYSGRSDLTKFRSIETQYTRTGFGGLWGNKGGVSVSVVVDGISICFLNSHLAAHYEYLEQRINDYDSIINDQYFVNTRKPNILSHDYVIWIGDLNFRIDDLSGDQIHDIIQNIAQNKSSNYSLLLDKDQLNRVRREGRAFSEFTESVPTFAPTYKFFVNTDSYDYKSRKPAFTDRILYRFTANAYENFKLDLKQIDYKSHPQYKQSDHKPVSALFHLKTKRTYNRLLGKRDVSFKSLSDTPVGYSSTGNDVIDSADRQAFITFLPITDWRVSEDSTAWYTVTPNDQESIDMLSPWDWIGLYKSDFMSIDDQMSFVWANPVPNQWSRPSVHQLNSLSVGSSDEQSSGQSQSSATREPWFSVQYSDQSLLIPDQYRLVYVSQLGDVLGISEPFIIRN